MSAVFTWKIRLYYWHSDKCLCFTQVVVEEVFSIAEYYLILFMDFSLIPSYIFLRKE